MSTATVFDFEKDYILENERVLLRRLTKEDVKNLLVFAINEPQIWKFSLVPIVGELGLEEYIDIALAGGEARKEYPFIVFDKKTGQYAGCTRFADIQLKNQSLQLGYTWYGKDFQGTGLNKHCKFLLFQFAFETMNIERIEFRADNSNERSKAAMLSIGCTIEGVLRSLAPIADGSRPDRVVLSILKEEWLDHAKENLKNKLK